MRSDVVPSIIIGPNHNGHNGYQASENLLSLYWINCRTEGVQIRTPAKTGDQSSRTDQDQRAKREKLKTGNS